jgi:hypothetical protein
MLLRSDYNWADSGNHHSLLKKRKAQRPFKKSRKAPTPLVDRGLMYEVSKVIKSRVGKWGTEYLVHWKGYAAIEDSWIAELPVHFRKTFPNYKQGSDSGSGSESESGSESDSESEASEDGDGSDDEYDDVSDERMRKCARTAEVTREKEALEKQCAAVSALLALSKAVVKLYQGDTTESDSD